MHIWIKIFQMRWFDTSGVRCKHVHWASKSKHTHTHKFVWDEDGRVNKDKIIKVNS